MLLALGIGGALGLFSGIVVAAFADVFPAHRAALQEWGAGALIASVVILGFGVPLI